MLSHPLAFGARRFLALGAIPLTTLLMQTAVGQERSTALAASDGNPLTVVSSDGTRIAYERSGNGPALVIVASALATRRDASRLARLLAPSFTVFNHDRRGRGDSGDSERYAIRREIEDIDALVQAAGGKAFLFGSSSGAVLALEAANALGGRIDGLVLFEPPFIVDDSRPPVPDGLFARMEEHLAAGRRSEVVAAFMQECVGVPEDMLSAMQRTSMWRGMEKLAHTLPYDGALLAGLQGGKPLPKERWTAVRSRALIIDGERSDAFLRRAADALAEVLPGSERHTLQGQDHSAVVMAPQTLVPVLVDFLKVREPEAAGTRPAAAGAKRSDRS